MAGEWLRGWLGGSVRVRVWARVMVIVRGLALHTEGNTMN